VRHAFADVLHREKYRIVKHARAVRLLHLGKLLREIGELLTKTEDDLLNITNFGQKSLDEVKEKLDERGLTLRG
jgi:DNA-directed RNA polymerase alpha subunit